MDTNQSKALSRQEQHKSYNARRTALIKRLQSENQSLREQLKNAGYAARESGWVRVEDGLPDSGELVMWTMGGHSIMVGYLGGDGREYEKGKIWRQGGNHYEWLRDFRAWMPLPQPYEEKA